MVFVVIFVALFVARFCGNICRKFSRTTQISDARPAKITSVGSPSCMWKAFERGLVAYFYK